VGGKLQGGRGRGLQEASTEPSTNALVIRCSEQDARRDGQLNERGVYFERLVISLEIPVDTISFDFADPDLPDAVWFDTPMELARSGARRRAPVAHRPPRSRVDRPHRRGRLPDI